MKRLLILSPLCALALSGCFTGVEYTPKITASDVKKEQIVVTAEDTFLRAEIDAPLAQWRPGKLFRVTDARIARALSGSPAAMEGLEGRDLAFTGVAEGTSVTGTPVTDLHFTSPAGHDVSYRVAGSRADLEKKPTVTVPFTVQLSTVEAIGRKLDGNRYYILTDSWRDDSDNTLHGRKFIPVRVDSVRAGNSFFPVKVSFTAEADSAAERGCVYLYPGVKGEAPRTFSHLFSFTDPHLRYPEITDATWQLIKTARVTDGMTREECRLALGDPKERDRGASNTYIREVWLYDNGIYLLFEDGVLKRHKFAK